MEIEIDDILMPIFLNEFKEFIKEKFYRGGLNGDLVFNLIEKIEALEKEK